MSASSPSASVARCRRPPLLRWLNDVPHSSSPQNPSPSLSSHSSSSHSPDLTSHGEPLHEPLNQCASLVHLCKKPPLFCKLTRCTLPISSIADPPAFISAQFTPARRSSLETLRSISSLSGSQSHTRSIFSIPYSWQTVSSMSDIAQCHRKYRSPKNPIVFCHGLLGFDSVSIGPAIAPFQVPHWRGITEALDANGSEVLITCVPATSSPADRAIVLEKNISEVYAGRSVHLIGHSMGGLDCRYLTTHLTNRSFSVLSVTTIATPHHGSSFADHFLATIGPARMPSFLAILGFLPNGSGDGKAFQALTLDSMRKFNEETPDVKGVRYFSWGAVYEPSLIDAWKWTHDVIFEKEGPNDGLVSVQSSKWGTYLGTLSQVNHLDLVGWISTARYKWAQMMGKEIKFRPATFYLGIADMLAGEFDGILVEGEEGLAVKKVEEGNRRVVGDAINEDSVLAEAVMEDEV